MSSFKERLQQVSMPDELHDVMRDLLRNGSPNWTYEHVTRYVAPWLWDEVERYFAGRHLPQSDAAQGEGDSLEAKGESLSAVIARFHDRLHRIRVTGSNADSHPPADPEPVNDDAESVKERSTIFDTVFGSAPRHPAACDEVAERTLGSEISGPVVAETNGERDAIVPLEGFFCPICDRIVDEDPADYRGQAMCRNCVALLRGL